MDNIEQSTPQQIPIPEPGRTNNVRIKFLIVALLCVSVGVFAFLTKTGAIPNRFNIEILHPKNTYKKPEGIHPKLEKPIIYLYPKTQQDVKVELNYKGNLVADFPKYDPKIKGWRVSASPNGTLTNYADSREYSYIFWEGIPEKKIDWDLSEGFVVKGEDTREFLQEKLAYMGLSPKEYNEFIVYWYPLMQNNPYNLIHFAGTQYTETAPLTITPTPDAILRVFMVYKPLQEEISITEQSLKPFERKGFTVIEWGGTETK